MIFLLMVLCLLKEVIIWWVVSFLLFIFTFCHDNDSYFIVNSNALNGVESINVFSVFYKRITYKVLNDEGEN